MTFAKLENNSLTPAPGVVKITGATVFNPSPEQLRGLGYKEVIYPPVPEPMSDQDLRPEAPETPMREVYTQDAERIYVDFVPTESAPVPDPAALRGVAYREQADLYLTAYNGYLLEGHTAQAEEQKALYLAKKTEIRTLYPSI